MIAFAHSEHSTPYAGMSAMVPVVNLARSPHSAQRSSIPSVSISVSIGFLCLWFYRGEPGRDFSLSTPSSFLDDEGHVAVAAYYSTVAVGVGVGDFDGFFVE